MLSTFLPRSRLLGRVLQLRRGMAEMPVPQSSKAVLFEGHPQREGWESTLMWWYPTSFVLICLVLGTTPETDIQAWAQREAAARLQLADAGVQKEFQFGTHYQDLVGSLTKAGWDKFSSRSVKFLEDDEEEEEEEDAADEEDDE